MLCGFVTEAVLIMQGKSYVCLGCNYGCDNLKITIYTFFSIHLLFSVAVFWVMTLFILAIS
jgi:hypothetical protein